MTAAPPIFLHSGFRSGSTWFWSKFREISGTHAYYEPFHENKAVLTPETIAGDRGESWNSGHSALAAPYNAEYLGVLKPGGGVLNFDGRFAYDAYYSPADDGQRRYIESLIGHAEGLGKVPVFGFTRSMGRVPWLKAAFPGVHVVTLRDPWDQWASVDSQADRGNHYFHFRYYLIALIGRHGSPWREFFDGLMVPELIGRTADEQMMSLNAFFQATSVELRFRIFLRVFLLDALLALPHADLVIDLDRMSAEAIYREEQALRLRHRTGLDSLSFDGCVLPHHATEPSFRTAFEETLAILDRPLPFLEHAVDTLRTKLDESLARFTAESSQFDPLLVRVALAAIAMVDAGGSGTDRAMAFLGNTLGSEFDKYKFRLADITQTAAGPEAPAPLRTDRACAERLYRALTSRAVHTTIGAR